jgi:mRNA-degrading endonuclease RelE of RelBE toxin-antitoxin system
MNYRLLIDFEVLVATQRLPVSLQRRLYHQFQKIQKNPGNCSDYVEEDERGRTMQISEFGVYRIQYWIDDADEHVKILELEKNE